MSLNSTLEQHESTSGAIFSQGFERIDYSSQNRTFSSGKILTGILGLQKIAVSKEKRRIYLGGKGLNILESKGAETSNLEYEVKPQSAKLKSIPLLIFS